MADEGFKRKLTAVLSADAVGYSRLMAEDEADTVKTLATYRDVISSLINQHRGRVVDSPGDNILAEFSSVVDAVQCAVAVQNEIQAQNAELPNNRRMEFRIGINLGDVIDEDDRIYGDGVNIAARLEAMADPGGICVSKTAFDQIETKLPLGYEYLGEQSVKNIPKPIGAYRVLMKPDAAGKVIGEKRFLGRYSRRTAIATMIILVMVVGGLISWNIYLQQSKRIEPASLEKMAYPLPEKPSIAVLPFANLSNDPDQDYIADGISDNIITFLSKSPDLFVIARNSAFTYKGKPVKVQQVSEDLGVRYIIEGSVQKSDNRVRVNAQLIDAIKGHHLWSERYDIVFKDLFSLQDEIVQNILTELHVELTWGETGRYFETDNLKAWEHTVKGLDLYLKGGKEKLPRAKDLFEKAIDLDRNYALPLLMLGWTHLSLAKWGMSDSPDDYRKKAFELAQKALAMDKTLSGAHSLLNSYYLNQRQYDKAISEGKKAVSLAPNNPLDHAILARTQRFSGLIEESIHNSEKAIRLQPHYPSWYLSDLCMSFYYAERYEEAVTAGKQYLEKAQTQGSGSVIWGWNIILALNYIRLGNEKRAREHMQKANKLFPSFNLELNRATSPYRDVSMLEKQEADFRRLGIPEKPPQKASN
jgi:adenylate cyclase